MGSIHEIPAEIRRGYSEPTPQDFTEVEMALEKEKIWYKGWPPYRTNADVLRAAEDGSLVKVEPTPYAVPAMRFRAPELHDIYPPYLQPFAALALNDISRLWARVAQGYGVSSSVRLAITSLTRSEEYQRMLIDDGKLATSNSTHTKGAAFDLALADYYLASEDGLTSVSLRPPESQEAIAEKFQSLGAVDRPIPRLGPEAFNHNVPRALLEVARISGIHGYINAVEEFPGQPNSCLHIGVHPAYRTSLE